MLTNRKNTVTSLLLATVTTWCGLHADDTIDFGRDIQPILSDRCYACHGQDAETREGGLRLDKRDAALTGGDSGAAFVPGNSKASELVQRILSEDPDELMPPPKNKKALTEKEKKLLIRWIDEGAEYSNHWSFEPIKKIAPPKTFDKNWPLTPIDHFVLNRLEKENIQPSKEAERITYIRRVTQDLTGLTPTPEEVDKFVSDSSPNAHENLVNRLLTSVDYAERMTAIWLDNARYADSNSYQFDNARTMWPWRDWVIGAFRQNMPYNQFVTEQLAGDLLINPTHQQLIATGFNRNHGYSIEGGIIDEEYRVTYANDKTTTAGTLFLGLTMDCCRCHNHKYDPISIGDYYSFYAFFNTSAEVGAPGENGRKQKTAAPYISTKPGDKSAPLVMIMKEKQRETFILKQGQFDQPGDKVTARTPDVLPKFEGYEQNRLGLAKWLTAPENPLFARVTVNRVWQQFFGVGIVKTPDNFGLQGALPSHPQLLDWLATDFRENNWDMQHLIRQIVLSATYRQHSRHRPELDDPDNRLLARGPSFRLPAETIRDQALGISGLLTRKVGGPSVRPYQPAGIWEDLNAPKSHAEIYKQDSGPDLYRKSMYTYWRRAAMHPGMAVFDAPNRDICSVERPTTNTPLQALATLHDPTYIEAARKLAERILKQRPDVPVTRSFQLVLTRNPNDKELTALNNLHRDRLAHYQINPTNADKLLTIGSSSTETSIDRPQLAALTDICLAIMNLSETVTRK